MEFHSKPTVAQPRRAGAGTSRRFKALFSIFFALFVAGGLYFGYIFVVTVASALGAMPISPPGVPFFSAGASPGTAAESVPTEPSASLPDWQGSDRVNVLLLGIDQREAERGQPTRSDTMIILTVDPKSKSATMIHIPRDLWVVVPGHGENKINTAHFYGEWDAKGKGPELAKKTIETAFGIRMHYYARVDFGGFEKLVDAVGGVTIDVPKAIKDDEYPTPDYGVQRIYIPVGPQYMDGRRALQYARSRHADNDLGRGQRQTQVVAAAKAQAMRLDLLPRLPSLLGILRDALSTDVPATDLLSLINLARQIEGQSIATKAIGPTMVTDIYGDGSVLMPDWPQIRALLTEVFADPQVRSEGAKIAVQNGTLRDGLAAAIGAALRNRGFDVGTVAQANRSDYRETAIIDRVGDKTYTVQKLADLLHVDTRNVIRDRDGSGDADLTVILGADARVP